MQISLRVRRTSLLVCLAVVPFIFTPSAGSVRDPTLNVTDAGLTRSLTVALTSTETIAVLDSIAVTPSTPSIIVAGTQQFTATGTFSDGSTQNTDRVP